MGKSKKSLRKNDPSNVTDKYLLIGFLSIILLHILGGFWHSSYSWGFSYFSVFSHFLTVIIGLISLGSVFALYTFRYKVKLDILDKFQFNDITKPTTTIFSIISTIALGSLLFLFRSKAHVYGDGYTILEFCSTNPPLELIDQYYLQSLAVYWHQFMFKVLSPFPFFEGENIFALTNVVGGLIGFWAIYKITGLLSRNTKERLFFLIISLSSASIILFFGYIENYTWAMSFMLWSIYYCLRYIHDNSSIYPLLICSIIAFSFHMITMTVLVTIFFVLLYKAEKTKKFLKRSHFVGYILAGSLLILLVAQLNELDVFVPLWNLPKNNYSLFTFNHLLDITNLLLLLAPMGLLYFLISLQKNKQSDLSSDSTEQTLFIISLLTFISACFIDPQLGMLRDFDLFAFYGIPLTLWGGYRFSRIYTEKQFPIWVIIASMIVALVHIVPNIYEKNHPQVAVEYLDKVLWEDPHYQIEYQDAYRTRSWVFLLNGVVNRKDLAEKYYNLHLSAMDNDYYAILSLGDIALSKGNLKKAEEYFKRGMRIAPNEPRFLSSLASTEVSRGNLLKAEEYARSSLGIDSSHSHGLLLLGTILSKQKKYDEALFYLRRAKGSGEVDYQEGLNLGIVFAKTRVLDSAFYYFEEAKQMAPHNKKAIVLRNLITLSLSTNRKSNAIDYLDELKAIDPQSPNIKLIESAIYGK